MGPVPITDRSHPGAPRHDAPQTSHPPRTATHPPSPASTPNIPFAAGGRTSGLMIKCSHHDGGHNIPSAIPSPTPSARARSLPRTPSRHPGPTSAHPPAATGTESASADPAAPIRPRRTDCGRATPTVMSSSNGVSTAPVTLMVSWTMNGRDHATWMPCRDPTSQRSPFMEER